MSDINWQDPPPNARHAEKILAPDVLAALRAKPGQWARVSDDAAISNVTHARRRHPDLEIVSRSGPEHVRGRGAIYARVREVTS